eukprot:gene11880-13780_t
MGVARMSPHAVIVASNSYHADTDLGAVKQVLDQPTNNFVPGQHFNFNAGEVTWHLVADDKNLVYVLITSPNYPLRCAHACLEELQRTFTLKMGERVATAKERSLDGASKKFLQAMCAKYDNLPEVDKLAALSGKVNSVKLVMQSNVDAALQNCVKLDSLEAQAEELQQAAGMFGHDARRLKNKLWWKDMKMKIYIALIVLVILGVIIGVAVGVSQNK